MRSRYTAYVRHEYDHLQRSLSAADRPQFDREGAKRWAESSEWLGLTITGTSGGGVNDQEGTVSFTARFRNEGQEHEHVEKARFGREDGRWVYVGQENEAPVPVRRSAPKVGRNDPCPCGSGKKYKKCCGASAAG